MSGKRLRTLAVVAAVACTALLLGTVAGIRVFSRPGENGYDLLAEAANKSPREAPQPSASIAELKDYVQRGAAAVELCETALASRITVPPSGITAAGTDFRPLFRLLRLRGTLGKRLDDPKLIADSALKLYQMGSSLSVGSDVADRDVGFVCDVYIVSLLEEGIPVLTDDLCSRLIDAVGAYLSGWQSAKEIYERTVENDRRRAGDKDVEARQQSGSYEKGRAHLERQLKLHFTLHRMLAVKLAIRRHELSTGRVPETLEAITEVSVLDPFAPEGRALRYRPSEGSYLLYSVGPDGQDDGGKRKFPHELLAGQPGDLVL